jgi:hypothetical protein
MSHLLSTGQRFSLNPEGHYTVEGRVGTERVLVSLDPSVTMLLPGRDLERGLMNLRARIQAAARKKWEGDEVSPQLPARNGPSQPRMITLTAEDLDL